MTIFVCNTRDDRFILNQSLRHFNATRNIFTGTEIPDLGSIMMIMMMASSVCSFREDAFWELIDGQEANY